ncbi:class III lanthionine synthetase LanKC [Streptomyces sp. NBC_00210]|uniref:class III lanthionine synthetase LanKC n=1 Tax=unclassified Streptomyces TaxID=2593676 RepID=UPI00324F236F
MAHDHHRYADADPHFYDHPADPPDEQRYTAADRTAPAGWRREESKAWVYLRPEGLRLPDQGWKIHVSAAPGNAAGVIDVVSAYCTGAGVAYKFLPNRRIHLLTNSKYARRGSSGKLMTLYPTDDGCLARTLEELDPLLAGQPGPYVLGDLRWREGPLYLRYGGFRELWCTQETGERVLAVAEPDGTFVPDRRDPVFRVPEWLTPPEAVTRQLRADEKADRDGGLPYPVERALHFSNGGGIYLAHDRATGNAVVLREARPLAGLDGSGVDAVTRLRKEAQVLKDLSGLEFVPALLDEFTAWEHEFLVEEYIEGDTLRQFTARNNPLVRPDPQPADIAAYTGQVLDIVDQLQHAVDALHERGLVFGDLHPSNVLVQPDGRVRLVDFEAAHRPDVDPRPALQCPGFVAPHAVEGFARDRYALDSIRLTLFLPLTVLLDLAPDKVDEFADTIAGLYPLPPAYVSRVRAGLRRPDRPEPEAPSAAGLFTGAPTEELRAALARAITASATPGRDDRLFPGDPAGLHDGGYTLAHGAAGVLHALATTGQPVDPEHTEWLWQAVRRAADPRPGLYSGLHGAALALGTLGRDDQALEVLGRAIDATGPDTPASLHGGLAGVGLTLHHFVALTGDGGLRDELAAVTERLAEVLAAPAPEKARAGLMQGPTGTAAFFLHLYETDHDPAFLGLAQQALRTDLQRCATSDEGAVNLQDGNRLLPYIEPGSAGVGLVLGHYLRHRYDEEFATALRGILRAARGQLVTFSGLWSGRAGLMTLLAQHPEDQGAAAALTRHIRQLAWHAIPYREGIAFPGDQLYRLSMDVATGTAGVLLALHAASGAAPVVLPGLPGSTAAASRH